MCEVVGVVWAVAPCWPLEAAWWDAAHGSVRVLTDCVSGRAPRSQVLYKTFFAVWLPHAPAGLAPNH